MASAPWMVSGRCWDRQRAPKLQLRAQPQETEEDATTRRAAISCAPISPTN